MEPIFQVEIVNPVVQGNQMHREQNVFEFWQFMAQELLLYPEIKEFGQFL